MSTTSGNSSPTRVVQRASIKLQLAGAFDPAPVAVDCGWAKVAWLMIDYQEGIVAGGAPQMIIELSDGVNFYRTPIEDAVLTVVPGVGDAAGTANFIDETIKQFRPRANFRIAYRFELDKGVFAIRPNFAEYPPGTIATPGTLGCVVLLSVD